MDDLNEIEGKKLIHIFENISRNNAFKAERINYYHYTNYDNLNNIIHRDGYRFKMTDYEFFEDKLEGKLIIQLYKEVVAELYNNNLIKNDLYNILNSVELNDKGLVKVSKDYYDYDKYRLFVTCFTNKINDTYMWNNYGNGTSKIKMCIVAPSYLFNTQHMCINKINQTKVYDNNYKVQKVIYDKNEQKEMLKASILNCIELYNQDNTLNRLKFYILEDLKYYQLMFKTSDYAKENEFRIIYTLSEKNYVDYKKNNKDVFIKFIINENKPVLFLNLNEECTNVFVDQIKDNQINDYDN